MVKALLQKYLGFSSLIEPPPPAPAQLSPEYGKTQASSLWSGAGGYAPSVNSIYDGDKFPGGFGVTKLYEMDYWTIRERSGQLFRENLYAKGLIRRLITNEINTGLIPEASPEEAVLGLEEGALDDWSETIEARFAIWSQNPHLCDHELQKTFGEIQEQARIEALIEGDVLVVARQSRVTRLPMIQLVQGARVRTPFKQAARKGNTIEHGVELDSRNRQVAYWVQQDDMSFKRIPAFGEKSGRRMAWLHYGTEKRLDDVRGESLLSVILQSLKEVDRYRDSAQRKAVIASLIAMVVTKDQDKMGSLPISGGAARRSSVEVADGDGSSRTLNMQGFVPGMVVEELQAGEDIVMKGGDGTDINFAAFEEAIIQGVAWANEIPPEILRLSFSNNYSASQAAINEFKIYLNKRWKRTGDTLCTPIYIEWLISEALLRKVSTPGLLESWRDPAQYDTFGAIVQVEWYGSIKPSTDMLKAVNGAKAAVAECWTTNARESRALTGTKFRRNVRRVKRENELKVEAARPLAEFKQEFNESEEDPAAIEATAALEDQLDTMLLERGLLEAI